MPGHGTWRRGRQRDEAFDAPSEVRVVCAIRIGVGEVTSRRFLQGGAEQ